MIFFIGNYARQARELSLFQSPAAANKMQYILNSIKTFSPCTLVSLAVFKEHRWKYYRTKTIKVDERETDVIMPSIGSPIRALRIINSLLVTLFAFFYTLFHVKKDDTVILYHSLASTKAVLLSKYIKNFRLILEVEEIYADVSGNRKGKKKEMRYFEGADAYIFPTRLLDAQINVDEKPSVIIHGTYQVESDRGCRFEDGKIHVVYAGTFDPRKGGADAASTAAYYLDDHYHIHILGFGRDEDKKNLLDTIQKVSGSSKCTVTFDGLKSGEEYIEFIQCCDIGLSTQNPEADFNATSFPSKILSYMANGLRVVSIRIPAIEQSAVGRCLYYYDEQLPEKIARAISSVEFGDDYNSRRIITELSNRFTEELAVMILDKGTTKNE